MLAGVDLAYDAVPPLSVAGVYDRGCFGVPIGPVVLPVVVAPVVVATAATILRAVACG